MSDNRTVVINGIATEAPLSEVEMMEDFKERFHDVFSNTGTLEDLYDLSDEILHSQAKLNWALGLASDEDK